MKKDYGHQSCPACPSSDAYYLYKDGHGHCFSCGYHDWGTKNLKNLRLKMEEIVPLDKTIKTSNYTSDLPKIALKWLKKYNISNLEISKYKLLWNEDTTSLVFPIYHNGRVVVTSERYFGTKIAHPKYLTRGNKTKYYWLLENKNSSTVVLVEDCVSAIKVARVHNAVPILGTSIPVNWPISLSRRFSRLRVWLDSNRHPEAITEALKASQYISDSEAIIGLNGDPKDYDQFNI